MRTIRVGCLGAALGLALAAMAGCGAGKAAVSGAVRLDDKPVEDGTISFVPVGTSTAKPAAGKVEGGSYAIPAKQGLTAGSYRVEVRWNRKTGRKVFVPPAPETDEVKEAIPARYNSESELKADLKTGDNKLDFDLKSR